MEPQITDYYKRSILTEPVVPKEYYIQKYGLRALNYAQKGYEHFHNLEEGASTYAKICNSSAGVWEWMRMGQKLEQQLTLEGRSFLDNDADNRHSEPSPVLEDHL